MSTIKLKIDLEKDFDGIDLELAIANNDVDKMKYICQLLLSKWKKKVGLKYG